MISPADAPAWRLAPVAVGDRTLRVASRAGVRGHGHADVPDGMLASALDRRLAEAHGGASVRVMVLGSGNGLAAAVAAERGASVVALDRYAPHAEATRRTLDTLETAVPAIVLHAQVAGDAVAEGSVDVAVVRLPPDRASAQLLIAEAHRVLVAGGVCILAGANDEGAKPAARHLATWFGECRVEAQYGGCRLLVAQRGPASPSGDASEVTRWLDRDAMHAHTVAVAGEALTVCSRPGVFSWEHLDEATALLADLLQAQALIAPGATVLDLGCGSGVLAAVAGRLNGDAPVVAVDADSEAVRCAAATATRAGLRGLQARAHDLVDGAPAVGMDCVVSNPPFHLGKGTDLALPRAFIAAAHAALAPGGSAYLVANRTLPYEALVAAHFGTVRTVHDGRRFKVLGATRGA